MVRQVARILLIFGFQSFHWLVHGANSLSLKNNFGENSNVKARWDSFINSQTEVKDDLAILTTILYSTFTPENDTTINLFTKKNPEEAYVLKINDIDNLEASPFNSERTTKIIVHGWLQSANTYWVEDMRRNYLNAGDYNVISLNWIDEAVQEYLAAATLTRQVGEYLGDFIKYLKSEGNLSYPNVHILGHSLGAHVAGFAGASTSSKIGRITGMDPAGPLFEFPVLKGREGRLDSSDALFVDVIHANAGVLGFKRAIGNVDFYPNGGFLQIGCPAADIAVCSHERSNEYMTESISGALEFVAAKCDSWIDYEARKCENNSIAIMGEHVNHDSRGKFFLKTNAEFPFARGF